MKQYAKSYELKNKAKDKLGGKYGIAVLFCFLSSLIPGAIRMFANLFFSPFLPSAADVGNAGALVPDYIFFVLSSLLLSIILGMFNVGIALFFLKTACGQTANIGDLFYGFKADPRKALTLSGIVAILNAVCLYPYQYMLDYFMLSRDIIWLYAAAVAMVIGICIYIPISLGLAFTFYLMLDFPDKSPKELLELSFRIMKGHKKRLFYIQLSFIPLSLLCVLTFYIGSLWLTPYMYMTEACFFLDLMNPKEVEG